MCGRLEFSMRVFVSNISDLMPRYRSSSLCTCCRLPFFPSNLYSARINIRRDFFPPFQAFIVCEHFSFVFAGQTAPHRKKIKYVNRIYARVKCWQVVFCSLVHIFATCSFFFCFLCFCSRCWCRCEERFWSSLFMLWNGKRTTQQLRVAILWLRHNPRMFNNCL